MKNRKLKPFWFAVGSVLGWIIATIIVFFAVGFVVSFAWNFTMPHVFNLPKLNVYQGFVIVILSRFLFFGFGRRKKEIK